MHFGFQRFAKKEDMKWTSIAIRNGNIVFIFTACKKKDENFMKHLSTHGDSVKNVAFVADDIDAIIEHNTEGDGFLVKSIEIDKDDNGFVRSAVLALPGSDVCHTLLSPGTYRGVFMPNYEHYDDNSFLLPLERIPLSSIDHFVLCFPTNQSKSAANYYQHALGLQEIWSIDESVWNTKHSAMRVLLLADKLRTVHVTLVEPISKALRTYNQIQEFLDYNEGIGVQHIAFSVDNIFETVGRMKRRGIKFIPIPTGYYDSLKARLCTSGFKLEANLDEIKKMGILMDFDDHGYLLQIFTYPVQDRPTLFFEVLQRNNFSGFGAANVKALYEAVETEKKKRGNLYHDI